MTLSKLSRHVVAIDKDGRTLCMLLNIKDHASLQMSVAREPSCLNVQSNR